MNHRMARSKNWVGATVAGIAILCISGVATWRAAAQEAPAAAFAERIEVRALEIEAVVMDRDGQRVEGLEVDDFRLLIDGEKVPIEYFAEVRNGAYVQTVDAYPGVVSGERSPNNLLIFIDEFFAIPTDRDRVLRALIERVPNLGPQDRVAITAWDGQELAVLTGWTSSQQEATAALEEAMKRRAYGLNRRQDRQQYSATTSPEDMFATPMMDPSMDRYRLGTQERQYAGLLVSQLQGVVGATNAAMRAFQPPPGRNVAVVLAGGWPMEVDQFIARGPNRTVTERNLPDGAELYGPIATTANLLGYTVYTVDMPGLQSSTGADASRATSVGAGAIGFTEFLMEGEIHNSLQYIASETGGLALLNGQRITSLSEVRGDVNSFYWISFSPQWAGDDELHDINVEVVDPELRVRTRAGFMDISPQSQVGMAVQSALLYGPFGDHKDFDIQVTEAEKAKKKKVDVTVKIAVPFSKLTVIETTDGYTVQTLMFVAALDPSGGRSDVPMTPLAVVSKQRPGPNDVVNYQTTFKLARKTSRLTIALYDVFGERTLVSSITKQEARQQQN